MNFLGRVYSRLWGNPFEYPPDFDAEACEIIESVKAYTMAHPEKLFALIQAVRHVVKHDIPGAMVECGVWRGGCVMAILQTLSSLGVQDRDIFLYDTFNGMTQPTEEDIKYSGENPLTEFTRRQTGPDSSDWCFASLNDVARNVYSSGYEQSRINFVKGKVEETLPRPRPDGIALLRLDTDWYQSTKHEMEYLFPLLASGGLLLVDDYNNWLGAKKAVEEYFDQHGTRMFLSRVRLGAIGTKP